MWISFLVLEWEHFENTLSKIGFLPMAGFVWFLTLFYFSEKWRTYSLTYSSAGPGGHVKNNVISPLWNDYLRTNRFSFINQTGKHGSLFTPGGEYFANGSVNWNCHISSREPCTGDCDDCTSSCPTSVRTDGRHGRREVRSEGESWGPRQVGSLTHFLLFALLIKRLVWFILTILRRQAYPLALWQT